MAKKKSSSKKFKKAPWLLRVLWIMKVLWFIIKSISQGIYYTFKGIYLGCKKLYYWYKELKEKKEEERLAGLQTEDSEKSKKNIVPIVQESFAKPKRKSTYQPLKLIEAIKGSKEGFEQRLLTSASLIGIILGARGSGKTGLGLRLLENIHHETKRACFAMGFKDLPKWITTVDKIEDIENNSVVLVDEGGILFSSRQSMSESNKVLTELILIARHKDLSIIFISQNSANIEINAIRQADYLMLKPSSLLQKDFERKKIKEIYDEVEEKFKKYKKISGLTYVYSETFKGFVSNNLPGFWTTTVSKGFREKL
ncbi:hypothetical protein HYY69_08205 [Candidatus Woesearchaeota archaeon]|nr:hypothetical protein [Candidatus Woesearchaeota archaeon]